MGVDFELDTIPFMEQDHETSVCATSALWTFLLANNFQNNRFGISPFSITNIALTQNHVCNEDILAPGFTIEMICSCIKEKGLIPLVLETTNNETRNLLELIHIYLKSGYPVILGLQVFSNLEDIDDKEKSIGAHAVTVVGDKLSESKIYIHDDRIGFYASLKNEDKYWRLEYTDSISRVQQKLEDEFYLITDFVTGVYPKIRLPVSDVQTFNEKLISDLDLYVGKIDSKYKMFIQNLNAETYIIESSKLKTEVRNNYGTYKNNVDEFLYMPLPKNCWVIKYSYLKDECMLFIFDATDMIHGDCLLYVLYKSSAYMAVMETLFKAYKSEIEKGISLSNVFDKHLTSLYQYFNVREMKAIYQKLDDLFGIAKSPRYIKINEFLADEIKNQKPYCFTCLADVKDFAFSVEVSYYLWIIDEEGYLYIGTEDNSDDNSLCKGHPTLINGGKGRIGGEIWHEMDLSNNVHWYLNSQSGRYSWVDTEKHDLDKFLENVLKERIDIYFPSNKLKIKAQRPRK